MKTKEEVIKEAWGKHWKTLAERGKEQALDDNGYCHENHVHSDLDCEIEADSFPDTDFIRPKSLSGIENNNGWIRIESEEDLPLSGDLYLCKLASNAWDDEDYIYNLMKDFHKSVPHKLKRALEYTHYQPIVKPKPPLY